MFKPFGGMIGASGGGAGKKMMGKMGGNIKDAISKAKEMKANPIKTEGPGNSIMKPKSPVGAAPSMDKPKKKGGLFGGAIKGMLGK